jgi:hypothetical protein
LTIKKYEFRGQRVVNGLKGNLASLSSAAAAAAYNELERAVCFRQLDVIAYRFQPPQDFNVHAREENKKALLKRFNACLLLLFVYFDCQL